MRVTQHPNYCQNKAFIVISKDYLSWKHSYIWADWDSFIMRYLDFVEMLFFTTDPVCPRSLPMLFIIVEST